MKRSLIPTTILLSIVSISLNGPPAYGGDRGHRGGRRVSSGFSGGHHFGSMPARGGQMFTRNGMGTWRGQRWGGHNWNGGNWSGQRWGGHTWSGSNWGGGWHNNNDVIFIGNFGFPLWWGWYPWGGGYPYGYYGYNYPYNYNGYEYGYGNYGYGYGSSGYDYGYGYPYGGYQGSYYGGTDYGNGYPTHSKVAELQRRLARAGYYSGAIDGIMGPETRQAIRAYERDHGY